MMIIMMVINIIIIITTIPTSSHSLNTSILIRPDRFLARDLPEPHTLFNATDPYVHWDKRERGREKGCVEWQSLPRGGRTIVFLPLLS